MVIICLRAVARARTGAHMQPAARLARLALIVTSVQSFQLAGARAGALVTSRAGSLRLTVRTPPVLPPNVLGRKNGGDGEGLVLGSVCADERRATLSLWQFQLERGESCADPDIGDTLRYMLHWEGDQKSGGPLCPLKGRNFSAYLGEDVIGMAIVRYKVDLTNFLEEGPRTAMVVEALVAPPELPRDAHEMVRMGLQNSLIELGQCHDMCVEFCSCHSDRDSAA